jgi:hypothetical protein
MKPDSDSDRPAPPPVDTDAIPLLTERLYVATLPPVVEPVEQAAGVPSNEGSPSSADQAAAEPSRPAPAGAPATPALPGSMAGAAAGVVAAAAAPPPVLDISVVREALLDDLERALPGQIESMIRREVSNAIDDAVFRVVAETQDALARAIGQVVERAVREELTRLRNEGG